MVVTERVESIPYDQVEVLSQKEGTSNLWRFLNEDIEFSELKPFRLALEGKHPVPNQELSYNFHLGMVKMPNGNWKKKSLYVKLPPASVPNRNETLYVVPKAELGKGANPYYWLDIYTIPPVEVGIDDLPVTSSRLNPGASYDKMIDSKAWRNIEEQLCVDYTQGTNNLTFDDLTPFNFFVNGASYRIGSHKNLSLYLAENPSLQRGDILRVIPRQDEFSHYQWLDAVKVTPDLNEHEYPKILSYRILSDEHKITNRGWYGPERQLFIDFLSGDKGVPYDHLVPFQGVVTSGNTLSVGSINDKQVVINLPKKLVGENVIVVPKQDEEGEYQWVDIYKFDTTNKTTIGEVVVSARLVNGKIIQNGWYGADKQRLADYTNGEKEYGDIKTIELTVGKSPVVSLWRDAKGKVYIAPSTNFNLKLGEKINLIPQSDIDTFVLVRGEETLGIYKFDKTTRKFYIEKSLITDKPLRKGPRGFRNKETLLPIPSDEAEEDIMKLL